MHLHELILIILTAGILIIAPVYMHLRLKMVLKPAKGGFNSRRIIKVTAINLLINLLAYLAFVSMLVSVLYIANFQLDSTTTTLAIAFLAIAGLPFYGNGIYITSIVIETFTPPDLRELKSFKTQFIATKLFHGPISHITIYSGYILAFFILSIVEVLAGVRASLDPILISTCGILAGMAFSMAQIFNGTILYQFITALTSFIILLGILPGDVSASIFNYSLAGFFFFFSLTFLPTALIYLFMLMKKDANIWYATKAELKAKGIL